MANEQNPGFRKNFKKGFFEDDIKKSFFNDTIDIPEKNSKELPLTIYAPAEQSSTAKAFAAHFGYRPWDIKGKKISGDEKYLTLAIKKDTSGLTFNYPGNIFDIQTRTLLPGLKLIPLDFNNDRKIDDNEKSINSLDQLTEILENERPNGVPVENIGFIVNRNNDSPLLKSFIEWVVTEGQKYNHTYGFLNLTENVRGLAQSRK